MTSQRPLCLRSKTQTKTKEHSSASSPRRHRSSVAAAIALTLLTGAVAHAHADQPGRGITADFEKNYLMFIIDHHFSALRMTELAAGTDLQRDAQLNNPEEGTSPTPNTANSPAKANAEEIKSLARRANRVQREEIAEAQRFLRDWYGVNHTPRLTQQGQQQVQLLEQAPTGMQFDQTFLEVFSSHHYRALAPSLDCQVKSDLEHDKLKHYCQGIVQSQIIQINNMRDQLCKRFSICDYQPKGIRGQHS